MASDLENSLIYGGISPAAAKIISNAIANASSSQLALGRRYGDATPVDQLRMVSPDTRRYMLGNLDQPRDGRFAKPPAVSGQYEPRNTSHTYEGSQPATAQPTLSTPSVKEGDFISVGSGTKDSVSQSTVSLRVNQLSGQHARLNMGTRTVEAVPFSVEIDQEQFMEAAFEERPGGTVLKIRLKNVQQFTDNDGTPFWGWAAS
jgi:hypothetical protein